MKRYITTLKNKLTLGFALGILASFVYAFLLKLSLEYFFDVYPIRGGLNVWDIGYFFSIVLWRFLIDSFLQLALGEDYKMPMASAIDSINPVALFTNKSDQSSRNDNSSSANSKKSDVSDLDESFTLQDDMMSNLKSQSNMMQKLLDLKRLHDIKYYEVNGALEMDVPSNVSDSELTKLSREVGIIDRIINTKINEYGVLEKKLEENTFFSSKVKKSIADYKELHIQRYKSLFEKSK